jgi:hypothetical protein
MDKADGQTDLEHLISTSHRRFRGTDPHEKPAWLVKLAGLCRPCSDAEFYGVPKRHLACEHGECRCDYEIPADAGGPA